MIYYVFSLSACNQAPSTGPRSSDPKLLDMFDMFGSRMIWSVLAFQAQSRRPHRHAPSPSRFSRRQATAENLVQSGAAVVGPEGSVESDLPMTVKRRTTTWSSVSESTLLQKILVSSCFYRGTWSSKGPTLGPQGGARPAPRRPLWGHAIH